MPVKTTPLNISSMNEARDEMRSIGVDPQGIKIMSPKMLYYSFKIDGVNSFSANIIKQYLLSLGSDAAVNRMALLEKIKTSIIVFGTFYQMEKLVRKLQAQPFELKEVASKIKHSLEMHHGKFTFRARDKSLRINKPIICGIINVTSDSFSGDGILKGVRASADIKKRVLIKVEAMVRDGAKMIDIGAESTRPYAVAVSEREEIKRLMPVLRAVRRKFPKLIISVDTYKYEVAKEALNRGVDVINDITAMRHSPKIASLVSKYNLGCILMHMKGSPRTMQINPYYKKGAINEVFDFLKARVEYCLDSGIAEKQLMIDPGIGFGKTVDDNYRIIKNLYVFKSIGLPIFLGVSRKSFIGKALNVSVDERLYGTISALVASYINGASALRVHDVKEARQALKIAHLITNAN